MDGGLAVYLSGVALVDASYGKPDKRQIAKARWVRPKALGTNLYDRLLVADSVGLAYRACLQQRAIDALWKAKVKQKCQQNTGGFYGLMTR